MATMIPGFQKGDIVATDRGFFVFRGLALDDVTTNLPGSRTPPSVVNQPVGTLDGFKFGAQAIVVVVQSPVIARSIVG